MKRQPTSNIRFLLKVYLSFHLVWRVWSKVLWRALNFQQSWTSGDFPRTIKSPNLFLSRRLTQSLPKWKGISYLIQAVTFPKKACWKQLSRSLDSLQLISLRYVWEDLSVVNPSGTTPSASTRGHPKHDSLDWTESKILREAPEPQTLENAWALHWVKYMVLSHQTLNLFSALNS